LIRQGHSVTILSRGSIDHNFAQILHKDAPIQYLECQNDSKSKNVTKLLRRYLRAALHPLATYKALKTGSLKERLTLSNQFVYIALTKLLKHRGRFDICHAHFGVHGVWAERLRVQIPYSEHTVVTFHGFDAWSVPAQTYDDYKWLAQRPITLTANSQCTLARVLELGFKKSNTFIWRMGVDLSVVPAKATQRPTNPSEVHIFSCGRLTPKKGHDDLIRAIGIVSAQTPCNIQLRILGGGTVQDMARLQLIAQEAGIANKLTLLGAQPHHVVWQELVKADVFALTSKTAANGDKEGLGVALLEASACGLPILATNSGGIPDAVIDGVTGLLAEEGNVADIAQKLKDLIQRRDDWENMGKKGQHYIEAEFSLTRTSEQIHTIYRHALEPMGI
jgi:colanic acid/amylovoran biosynthesis glycosyltransferase